MVKLSGPLHSLRASGTLKDVLTFNAQPGATTLRRKPQPKHPRSGSQAAVQAALTFVTQQWKGLNDVEKATWQDPVFVDGVSAYTNYVQFNCQRIRSLKPPITDYHTDLQGYVCQGVIRQAIGGVNSVYLWWRCYGSLAQTYGMFIYRDTVPNPSATFDKLIHVGLMDDALPHDHLDRPLAAGTYSYRWQMFSTGGRLSGPGYLNNRVVTDS